MDKPKMRYFEQEDVLYVIVAEGHESRSVELGPNLTAELSEDNELIGVEILNASAFLRDVVLDSVQLKALGLLEVSPA